MIYLYSQAGVFLLMVWKEHIKQENDQQVLN